MIFLWLWMLLARSLLSNLNNSSQIHENAQEVPLSSETGSGETKDPNQIHRIKSQNGEAVGQARSRQRRIISRWGRYPGPRPTPSPKPKLLKSPIKRKIEQRENGPLQQLRKGNYISRILELGLSLVNQSDPALGQNCWLCLSAGPSSYNAIPVEPGLWVRTKATIVLEKSTKWKATGLAVSKLHDDFYNAFKRLGVSRLPIVGPIANGVEIIGIPSLCVNRQQKKGIRVGSLTEEQCPSEVNLGPRTTLREIKLVQVISPTAHCLFQQKISFSQHPVPKIRRWGGWNISKERCPRPFHPPRYNVWLSFPADWCIPFPPGNITSRYLFEGPVLRDKKRNPALEVPLQPLTGMLVAGTLGVWINEKNQQIHAFSMNIGVCLEENGVFFLCGKNAYLCLPTNWTGTCTLVHLFPKMGVVNGEQNIPVPLMGHVQKRVPILIPLLAIMGIGTAIGTGVGGMTHSILQFRQLSEELQESLNQIAGTLVEVQDQIDSLAAVVLQNRRALDLLTAEKGGLCIFLGEACCFYMNKSGMVREVAKELQERASRMSQRSQTPDLWFSWLPGSGWIKQMLFLLICAVAGLTFIPCVIPILRQLSGRAVKEITIEKELVVREYLLDHRRNSLSFYEDENSDTDTYVRISPQRVSSAVDN